MIKYRIIQSKLSANPTGYAARIIPRGIVELDEIAQEIAELGTTVSKPDVLNVIQHYNHIIAKLLARGETVITPATRYRVSMQGTFTDEADSYDPERHHLVVRLTPGPELAATLSKAEVERYVPDPAAPNPLTYIDTATDERNGVVTPGAMGRLIGRRLQFDPVDPAQGLYFRAADGSATRVAGVGWNKDRQLMFVVPPLAAGDYGLEVRAVVGACGLRVGVLGAVLHVDG
jgi:DNA-binding domain/Domain of unknown function (DUF4469) with IG-like fold